MSQGRQTILIIFCRSESVEYIIPNFTNVFTRLKVTLLEVVETIAQIKEELKKGNSMVHVAKETSSR